MTRLRKLLLDELQRRNYAHFLFGPYTLCVCCVRAGCRYDSRPARARGSSLGGRLLFKCNPAPRQGIQHAVHRQLVTAIQKTRPQRESERVIALTASDPQRST